jgi:hypothetical protein
VRTLAPEQDAGSAATAARSSASRRAPAVPHRASTPASVLALQRSVGNAAVVGLLTSRPPPASAPTRVLARDGPTATTPPERRQPATLVEAALGPELAEKIEGMASNARLSSRSTSGHDMRFSLVRESELQLPFNFSLTSKYELSPDQLRLQWGEVTQGHRIDSWSGLRFTGRGWAVEALVRSTYASGDIAPVEHQQVGAIRLRLGDGFVAEYYNDHFFPFFPMGGGTDQGDTAGVSARVERLGLHLGKGWELDELGANLRLATGIPNRDRTVDVGGRTFYNDVEYDRIRQGLLSLGATFRNPDLGMSLRLEGGANMDAIRDATQNRMIHRPMGIPEFQNTQMQRPYFGATLTKEF